jgi:hypothetical protein
VTKRVVVGQVVDSGQQLAGSKNVSYTLVGGQALFWLDPRVNRIRFELAVADDWVCVLLGPDTQHCLRKVKALVALVKDNEARLLELAADVDAKNAGHAERAARK